MSSKPPTKEQILPLHTHTTYSLMDGVSGVGDYIDYCKKQGMEACSCTDHGYVLGLYDLIKKSEKADITGIPGVEAYLMPHEGYEFAPDKRKFDYFHLTLWAQNQVGYRNLLSLSSASWGPGRVVKRWGQPKPRVALVDLEEFNEGIICGSGCIEGPIVKPFLRGEKEMASFYAAVLEEIFGQHGRLFMEVMPHSVDRDWTTKGVIQVKGENGFSYTFKDTNIIETNLGWMTARQALTARPNEIMSAKNQRPQDFPFANRLVDVEDIKDLSDIPDSNEENINERRHINVEGD